MSTIRSIRVAVALLATFHVALLCYSVWAPIIVGELSFVEPNPLASSGTHVIGEQPPISFVLRFGLRNHGDAVASTFDDRSPLVSLLGMHPLSLLSCLLAVVVTATLTASIGAAFAVARAVAGPERTSTLCDRALLVYVLHGALLCARSVLLRDALSQLSLQACWALRDGAHVDERVEGICSARYSDATVTCSITAVMWFVVVAAELLPLFRTSDGWNAYHPYARLDASAAIEEP